MEWMKESWAYFTSWAATLGAVIYAVRTTYAAERDRQSLKQVELEREKLKLEIARLKNDPTVVTDRRAIYERLRLIVSQITRDAKVSLPLIYGLHGVIHDAEFRFPADVVDSIKAFLNAAIQLHVAGARLESGQSAMSKEQWERQVQVDADALNKIAAFEQGMVALFRSHLSL